MGNGTTADAVRYELLTGKPVGGVYHSQKAMEYSRGLEKRLASGDLDAHDSRVARSLLNDLRDALNGS